jgi:hypothetical protein
MICVIEQDSRTFAVHVIVAVHHRRRPDARTAGAVVDTPGLTGRIIRIPEDVQGGIVIHGDRMLVDRRRVGEALTGRPSIHIELPVLISHGIALVAIVVCQQPLVGLPGDAHVLRQREVLGNKCLAQSRGDGAGFQVVLQGRR